MSMLVSVSRSGDTAGHEGSGDAGRDIAEAGRDSEQRGQVGEGHGDQEGDAGRHAEDAREIKAAPAVPADVTITASTGSLAAFIVRGYDHDVEIAGDPAHIRRFRQLIAAMSTVVSPPSDQ
jgi:hypothetical protein